jgi:uncharacterized protein
MEKSLIIDSHCHYGPGDGFTGPWDTRADIDNYLKIAVDAGITNVALIPALARDYEIGNRCLVALISKHPDRFVGYVGINPGTNHSEFEKALSLFDQYPNLIGIKIHHYNGRITRRICEAAQRYKVIILWDNGNDPYAVELAASEYPRVNFIIPHLGSFGDDWRAQRACIDIICRLPNVYADTSGVRRYDLLQEACRLAGTKKLLFGSDGPWLNPALELEKIYQLRLSEPETQMILYASFLKLIEPRYRFANALNRRMVMARVSY